jgi:hypothetical protein
MLPEKVLTGPKIHFSELPPAQPGSQLAREWETYRGEVGRLITDGHEGKWVLIHNEQIIGIYETYAEARREGAMRFFVQRRPYLIRHILTNEPTIQTRLAG